jgi:hypothetical protein
MIRTIEEYLQYFIEELGGMPMTPTQFLELVQPSAPPARQTQHAAAKLLVQ